ncbi:QRFP-like peptide receptor [Trichonephila clavipes]|nr:QRFP-like peptide receptor [Trichonephila clavipes]
MNVSIYGGNSSDAGDQNSSEYLDYDRDESFSMYFLEELVPVAVIYGITLVVGLIGNLLIIYTVISFRRMRTISNVFLASLATADLLVVLICVPVKVAAMIVALQVVRDASDAIAMFSCWERSADDLSWQRLHQSDMHVRRPDRCIPCTSSNQRNH